MEKLANTNIKGVICVDGKKILMYFVSFLSLSLMFSASYYLSYKKALEDFNKNAVERNNELILSLEDKGLLISQDKDEETYVSNQGQNHLDGSEDKAVDSLDQLIVLPTTKYVLQTYDTLTGEKEEKTLPTPSYLVGLNREQINDYLQNYMKDLPWNEFQNGLIAYELQQFSEQEIVIRKTYNPELVEYEYFIKSVDGNIVVFYSDQKTVYEYTNMSITDLTEEEKEELEEGYFIKDLDELYGILENYSS